MSELKSYILLVGSHSEINEKGKVRKYEKGEIIESKQNLVKAFKNKFAHAGEESQSTTEQQLAAQLEEELEEDAKDEVVVTVLELKMVSRGNWTIINEDGEEVIDTHIPKAEAEVLLKELTS